MSNPPGWPPPSNILLTGSILFEGFAHLAEIEHHLELKLPFDIKVFLPIAAGLHPNGAIVITKKELNP